MSVKRPKIGVALSGASGRAIAHVAVLEVMKKHNIPVDVLVGCSSGALIAASYAMNTLEQLKEWLFQLTKPQLFKFGSIWRARGGLFHLNTDEAEAKLNEFTHGLNFEDIKDLKLAFVATDLNTGELVILNQGSIRDAFKAAVAVPVLFEPVVIDGRVLLDGGLVNIVPTKTAKELGADIIIGVNASGSRFIYEKKLPIWRWYRFFKRTLGIDFFMQKALAKLAPSRETNGVVVPGVFSVLSKSMDISFKVEEEWDETHVACDLMIEPGVKQFGKAEFGSLQEIYDESIKTAEEAIPQIQKLINDYQRS